MEDAGEVEGAEEFEDFRGAEFEPVWSLKGAVGSGVLIGGLLCVYEFGVGTAGTIKGK